MLERNLQHHIAGGHSHHTDNYNIINASSCNKTFNNKDRLRYRKRTNAALTEALITEQTNRLTATLYCRNTQQESLHRVHTSNKPIDKFWVVQMSFISSDEKIRPGNRTCLVMLPVYGQTNNRGKSKTWSIQTNNKCRNKLTTIGPATTDHASTPSNSTAGLVPCHQLHNINALVQRKIIKI